MGRHGVIRWPWWGRPQICGGGKLSPAEIVAATGLVAKSFGEDIAHDVLCIYLEQRPILTGEPIHWWRRTARYVRNEAKDKQDVRRAPRYWTEAEWVTRRAVASPQQYAACWELVDRIPAEVTLQLVLLEGVRGDQVARLTQQRRLRWWAMKHAGV